MRKLFYTFLLAIISSFGYSQTDSFGKIDFGFQGIGLGYEASLGDDLVLNTGAGIGGGYYVRDTDGTDLGYTFDLGDPTFNALAELKYLINEDKREERGKRTSLNSSNYVAYQIKFSADNTSNADNNQALLNEVHWGFQRRLGEESNFLFNMHLGLGYLHDYNTKAGSLTPTVGGKFAFKIFE